MILIIGNLKSILKTKTLLSPLLKTFTEYFTFTKQLAVSFPYSHLAPATILGDMFIYIKTERVPITYLTTYEYQMQVFKLKIL